jgi:hypothetical protein
MAGSPGWRSGIKHPRPARDADEVDEAGEGTWVVTGLGDDSLKAVAHGVGLDEEPLAGFGDVEQRRKRPGPFRPPQ